MSKRKFQCPKCKSQITTKLQPGEEKAICRNGLCAEQGSEMVATLDFPSKIKKPKTCPNCGGNRFTEPFVSLVNTGSAIDGRLRMNEISARFVIGCEECSETIKVLKEHEVVIAPKNAIKS